jgi:hypothetical protein
MMIMSGYTLVAVFAVFASERLFDMTDCAVFVLNEQSQLLILILHLFLYLLHLLNHRLVLLILQIYLYLDILCLFLLLSASPSYYFTLLLQLNVQSTLHISMLYSMRL